MRRWFFGLLFLSACAFSDRGLGPLPQSFQGTGTEQFFLPELPYWANGNLSAQCRREQSVRYLDHETLASIHGLDFRQRLELQTQFNRKWSARLRQHFVKALTPREENFLFLETLEQVKGGLKELVYPAQGVVQLVWWDALQTHPWAKDWLLRMAEQGESVLLASLCVDALSIETWAREKGLEDFTFSYIGAESMGPTGFDGTIKGSPILPLEAVIAKERLVLWTTGIYPLELPAGLKVKLLEDPHVRKKR